MKILVTGASGFVARNLRRCLSKDVDLVSVSTRNFKAYKNETKITTRNYTEKSIMPKIRGADAVIHLVGTGRQTARASYYDVNTRLTQNVIYLAKSAGIKRFVYMSGLGTSRSSALEYFASKFKAERAVINSKLNYTIFRPSYIVGKDDYLTRRLKDAAKRGRFVIPGTGSYLIQPIHIDDVTRLLYQAATENKFKGRTLDLVGPEAIPFESYARLFLKGSGAKISHISMEAAYNRAITDPKYEYGADDLNILVGSFTGDHKKLQGISKTKLLSVTELLKAGSLP